MPMRSRTTASLHSRQLFSHALSRLLSLVPDHNNVNPQHQAPRTHAQQQIHMIGRLTSLSPMPLSRSGETLGSIRPCIAASGVVYEGHTVKLQHPTFCACGRLPRAVFRSTRTCGGLYWLVSLMGRGDEALRSGWFVYIMWVMHCDEPKSE
jgi:hypothetical protein